MGLGLSLGFALKGAVGLKWLLTSGLKFFSLGFSMQLTLDHFTSHSPSGPHSNLRLTSNVKSESLTQLMLSVISIYNLALDIDCFLAYKSRISWLLLLKFDSVEI